MNKSFAVLALFAALFIPRAIPTASGSEKPPETEACEKVLTGVVVDAYSSGALLLPELTRRGIRVIHVHSNGQPLDWQATSFRPGNHITADIPHRGNLEETLEAIRKFVPTAILPGAESGVLLSDELAERLHEELGVPSNGVFVGRRDKYEMNKALRDHGLPTVLEANVKSVDEALSWIHSNKLWPGRVWVKVRMSSGGNGVDPCSNEAELRAVFAKYMGDKDKYGNTINSLLIQEDLQEPEYVMNSVSSNGKHIITDIWRYYKRHVENSPPIYDYDLLPPFAGSPQDQIRAYHNQVLDILKVRTGFAHAEYKYSPRRGIFVIIDFGNRMMGSNQPRLVEAATGHSQVDRGIDAFFYPERFLEIPDGYEIKKHPTLISLSTMSEGTVLSLAAVPEIEKLPGFLRAGFYFPEGTPLKKARDMDTLFGQVELAHEDPAVLQDSIEVVRQMEADGRFSVKP